MNRYFMIRRLRGPVFLLLLGVMFLLSQMHVMRIGQSWPLILIFFGVFMLAERAALADEDMYPPTPFAAGPGAAVPQGSAPPSIAIVPAHETDYDNSGMHHEGGE